jgi:hypothetical protein
MAETLSAGLTALLAGTVAWVSVLLGGSTAVAVLAGVLFGFCAPVLSIATRYLEEK